MASLWRAYGELIAPANEKIFFITLDNEAQGEYNGHRGSSVLVVIGGHPALPYVGR